MSDTNELERRLISQRSSTMPIAEATMFLEQVASGGTSGRFSEWPQLRPACLKAVERIAELEAHIPDNIDPDDAYVGSKRQHAQQFGRLKARIADLEAELAESQRLHDAGGSREAKLMTRLAASDRLVKAIHGLHQSLDSRSPDECDYWYAEVEAAEKVLIDTYQAAKEAADDRA